MASFVAHVLGTSESHIYTRDFSWLCLQSVTTALSHFTAFCRLNHHHLLLDNSIISLIMHLQNDPFFKYFFIWQISNLKKIYKKGKKKCIFFTQRPIWILPVYLVMYFITKNLTQGHMLHLVVFSISLFWNISSVFSWPWENIRKTQIDSLKSDKCIIFRVIFLKDKTGRLDHFWLKLYSDFLSHLVKASIFAVS